MGVTRRCLPKPQEDTPSRSFEKHATVYVSKSRSSLYATDPEVTDIRHYSNQDLSELPLDIQTFKNLLAQHITLNPTEASIMT